MKTPKEKAKELVDTYRIVLMNEDTDCGNEILCTSISKQCALITVEEIYNGLTLKYGQHLEEFEDKTNYFSYWEEVKTEIEKL